MEETLRVKSDLQGSADIATLGLRRCPQGDPLLLVAGLEDKTADPAMIKRIWRAYHEAKAPADFVAFPGHSHFLFAEAGWEEIADRGLGWLSKRGLAPAAQPAAISAE